MAKPINMLFDNIIRWLYYFTTEMLVFACSEWQLYHFSVLTSTSWVIAVSSDDGENDGGGATHTAHPQ